VFVIHGIRDRGFWTQKIARKAMAEAAGAKRVARSMTMSYGYLAMLPFVMPWVRRDKVRWLMDRYADCRALYPAAKFHYVGHSNGTYLVARALRDYRAARFQRIVLAGSVIRTDYDWRSVIVGGNQAEAVLNYVASGDWVVAVFPHGLSPFPGLDLGGAGHFGFDQLAGPGVGTQAPRISSVDIGGATSYQVYYVGGGHGAGIKESQWDDIAKFVVHGKPPSIGDPDYVSRQNGWVAAASRLPPLTFMVAVILLLCVLGAVSLLFAWVFGTVGTVIGGLASLLLLYALLTKF
jgi:pimeloyl-ACP methyl ester carboxylesterase